MSQKVYTIIPLPPCKSPLTLQCRLVPLGPFFLLARASRLVPSGPSLMPRARGTMVKSPRTFSTNTRAVSSSSIELPSSGTSGNSNSNAAPLSRRPLRSTLGHRTEPAHASSRHRRHAEEAPRSAAGPSIKHRTFCAAVIPYRPPPPPPPQCRCRCHGRSGCQTMRTRTGRAQRRSWCTATRSSCCSMRGIGEVHEVYEVCVKRVPGSSVRVSESKSFAHGGAWLHPPPRVKVASTGCAQD